MWRRALYANALDARRRAQAFPSAPLRLGAFAFNAKTPRRQGAKKLPTRSPTGEVGYMTFVRRFALSPNVAAHRRRVDRVQNEIEDSSRRSVHLLLLGGVAIRWRFMVPISHGETSSHQTACSCR